MNPIRPLAPMLAGALVPVVLMGAPAGSLAGTLEVRVSGGAIQATLTFVNHSQRVVWLEKIEDGQAPGRAECEIRSGDGRQVPYTGPTDRRKVHGKADFFPLEPGHTSKREFRLDDRYAFPEGEREYRLTFSYLSWNDRTRTVVSRSLSPVRFTYGR